MIDKNNVIQQMMTSRVRNYIIPGLNSYLLSDGTVRMFESVRDYAGTVTPHSHRFDFACYVLQGEVKNRVYTQERKGRKGDEFTIRTLHCDAMGVYTQAADDELAVPFTSTESTYTTGDWYTMQAKEFHSITFAKDTRVIFFEGPTVTTASQVLLPWMHGETIETMECDKDWMYLKDDIIMERTTPNEMTFDSEPEYLTEDGKTFTPDGVGNR